MMITRAVVSARIDLFRQKSMTLAQLVDWAENAVGFADLGPDEDVDLLMDVLMYLAAADTLAFPLDGESGKMLLQRLHG